MKNFKKQLCVDSTGAVWYMPLTAPSKRRFDAAPLIELDFSIF
jgi:hypothetical protein